MRNVYFSETLTATAGARLQYKLSFLPKRGPRGGRNVLSKLRVIAAVQVDTDGSTTIAAGGWARFLSNLRIVTAQGEAVNLSGPQLRALNFKEAGRDAIVDPALLAISQSNATRTIEWLFDFAPRRLALRRWDYALPVDHLHAVGDNAIEIEAASAANIGTGGGVTIDSMTFTLVAECREEMDVQDHVFREVRSVAQNQTTDFEIPISGGVLRNAFFHKYLDHITGGADLSATTGVEVPAIGLRSTDPAYLRRCLTDEGEHDKASTSDPWVQSTERVIPVVFPSAAEKITDMPHHSAKIAVRLTGNATSDLHIVYEVLYPTSRKGAEPEMALAQQLGLGRRVIKTAGKTRKDPGAWPEELRAILPGKMVGA